MSASPPRPVGRWLPFHRLGLDVFVLLAPFGNSDFQRRCEELRRRESGSFDLRGQRDRSSDWMARTPRVDVEHIVNRAIAETVFLGMRNVPDFVDPAGQLPDTAENRYQLLRISPALLDDLQRADEEEFANAMARLAHEAAANAHPPTMGDPPEPGTVVKKHPRKLRAADLSPIALARFDGLGDDDEEI